MPRSLVSFISLRIAGGLLVLGAVMLGCLSPAFAERAASFIPPLPEETATGDVQKAPSSILVAPDAKVPIVLPPPKLPPPVSMPAATPPEAKPEQKDTVTRAPLSEITPTPRVSATSTPQITPSTPSTTDVSTAPVPAAPVKPAPVEIAKPVASAALPDIDPDTLGLLSQNEGGFGASMWDNTSRALAERLLSDTNLPTASPTLNGLARRLLLSTAAVPAGEKGASQKNFISLRIDRLLSLGDVADAWKLATLTKPGRVDAVTMRTVTEAMLIGPESKALCDRIPEIMAAHNHEDWQKALVLCQLRAGDAKAVQLSLDVMCEQQVKDDVFIALANRAVLNDSKRLPHQLTPLRPLSLGVLRHIDRPLPFDLFSRPDAVLIPELIMAKAEDDSVRLALAERSAARGIIDANQLAEAYKRAVFSSEALTNALNSSDGGAKLHALLYQAAAQEQTSSKRTELITKFVQTSDPAILAGGASQLLAGLAMAIPPSPDANMFSALAARIYALAGKPDRAMEWLKIVQGPASKLPNIASEMQANWPLFVLAGIVPDAEYGKGLKEWLGQKLNDSALEPQVLKSRRLQAGNMLMLFNAAGFALPEEAWLTVMEASGDNKKMPIPSTVLLERLRNASTNQRRAETVLICLSLVNAGVSETPLFVTAEAVRALRLVGLTADALALAREAALTIQ